MVNVFIDDHLGQQAFPGHTFFHHPAGKGSGDHGAVSVPQRSGIFGTDVLFYVEFRRNIVEDLGDILAGIDAAMAAGYPVIKLNAVAIKNLTEPDVVSLVHFGRERGIEVRFIEFMPLDGQQLWSLDRVLTADDMLGMLAREFGPLSPVPDADPRAPATEYQFADGYRVGFIASVSRPFCLNCNRLRLTADGKLRYCLFAREETDIAHLLDDEPALEAAIRSTVRQTWAGHEINRASFLAPERPMYSIGG